MKRIILAVSIWLFLASLCWSALVIEGDLKVKPYKIVRLSVKGQDSKAAIVWDVDKEDVVDLEEVNGKLLMVAPPGIYKIKCRAIKLDKDGKTSVETARVTVTIEGDTPKPPDPGPTPDPSPTPTPAPIPVAGFRVLILYESADLTKLPKDQHNALYSKTVQDFMTLACVKENGVAAWNIWDHDVDTSKAAKHWQDAVKRAKSHKDYKTPWIMISDGKTGFEGPFPKNIDDTMTLLKKYAPPTRSSFGKKKGVKK